MVKPLRGECEADLGGTSYTLRLGIGELEELDNITGLGTVDLLLSLRHTSPKISNVNAVLRQALPGTKDGKKLPAEKVKQIVTKAGWTAAVSAAAAILASCLIDPNEDAEGNADAPEAETPATGA